MGKFVVKFVDYHFLYHSRVCRAIPILQELKKARNIFIENFKFYLFSFFNFLIFFLEELLDQSHFLKCSKFSLSFLFLLVVRMCLMISYHLLTVVLIPFCKKLNFEIKKISIILGSFDLKFGFVAVANTHCGCSKFRKPMVDRTKYRDLMTWKRAV